MTGSEWEKIIVSVLGIGIIGKIVWNWFSDGRIAKEPVYVTKTEFNEKMEGVMKTADCTKKRSECCVLDLKRGVALLQNDFGKIDLRISATERMLEKGDQNFKDMRSEIAKTNVLIAGLSANVQALTNTMEHKIERIFINGN